MIRRLLARLLPPEHPINLAVFRVTVFAVLIGTKDIYAAVGPASLPAALRSPPPGLGWLAAHLPVNGVIARAALLCTIVAGAAALIGFKARWSAAITTVTALYLLGVPQLYGTVRHYHHLVWFAALLAASPCGDALSVDALLRARRGAAAPRASLDYTVPIRAAWILIGLIYFFPGVWKLAQSGWAWAFSDNLVNQLRWKWLQYDWLPLVRIDRYPRFCQWVAAFTIVFEIAFLFIVWFRRARPVLVAIAISFHLATAWLMHISFTPLWLCYTVFFDWSREPAAPAAASRAPRASLAVAAILVLGNLWCGVRGRVESWPFACYPTFQWRVEGEMPDLEVAVADLRGRGAERTLAATLEHADSQRRLGLAWSLLNAPSPPALTAYYRQLAARDPAAGAAAEVRFYRVSRLVDPDHWRDPPRRVELLYILSSPSLAP